MSYKESSCFPCTSLAQAARDGLLEDLKTLVNEGNPLDAGDTRGWRPLHEAAQRNHVDCVKFILQQDACDVNWQSFEGTTALNLSCMEGHVEVVKLLLGNGADPNIGDHVDTYPILNAVRCSSLDCVKLLVEHHARVNVQLYCGTTPLHHAASEGLVEIVAFLLDKGASLSLLEEYSISPLFSTAQYGQEDCCRLILDKAKQSGDLQHVISTAADDGATPLYLASQEGYENIVQLLLDHGASANTCTENPVALPLHAALQFNHADCVKLLLPHTDLTLLDRCDVSAFYFSMTATDTACTKELLNAGISPSHRHSATHTDHYKPISLRYFQQIKYSKRISPLVELAINGNGIEHAKVLIEAGASVNARTPYEAPPLLVALEYRNYDLVTLLLYHGASVNNYHPKIICNMSLVSTYSNWNGLNMMLKLGVEARSMFALTPVQCTAPLSPARCRLAELEDDLSEQGEDDYENEIGVLRYPIPFWRHLAETRMNGSRVTFFQMMQRVLHFVGSVKLDPRLESFVDSKEEWLQLASIMDCPRTLSHLCRLIIRDKMGPQRLLCPDHIQSLPLPYPVIDFLLYKELES